MELRCIDHLTRARAVVRPCTRTLRPSGRASGEGTQGVY